MQVFNPRGSHKSLVRLFGLSLWFKPVLEARRLALTSFLWRGDFKASFGALRAPHQYRKDRLIVFWRGPIIRVMQY